MLAHCLSKEALKMSDDNAAKIIFKKKSTGKIVGEMKATSLAADTILQNDNKSK